MSSKTRRTRRSPPDAASVRRVVDWVVRVMPSGYLPESVEIKHGSKKFRGEADEDGEVTLFIPAPLPRYPRRYAYRKAAGKIYFKCWCEELVCLVGHELRHVAQDRARKDEHPPHYEVDAEAVGRFVLDLWREKKRCPHAA